MATNIEPTVRGYSRAGSVYRRASDGMWVASVEIYLPNGGKRRRKVLYSRSEDGVREKLRAYITAHPPRPILDDRSGYRRAARALGRCDREKLIEKYLLAQECPVCRTALNPFNKTRDHIRAVTEGGDDSIDNTQYLCWQCNSSKSNRASLRWDGPPRPFSVYPCRRAAYERFLSSGKRMEDLTVQDIRALGMRIR